MLQIPAITSGSPLLDTIYHTDAFTLLQALSSESVDVIITDPPYPQKFLPLYEMLSKESARILKQGGSLLAMCGQSWLPVIYETMSRHLRYHWTICYFTPGAESAQQWPRKVLPFWKPVLWFVKGQYTGNWVSDIIHSPSNDKVYHTWGQSIGGITELVRRFSHPGDLIVDPFVGGGTTVIAARNLSRRFLACDIDRANVEKTRTRLAQSFTLTLPITDDIVSGTPKQETMFTSPDFDFR